MFPIPRENMNVVSRFIVYKHVIRRTIAVFPAIISFCHETQFAKIESRWLTPLFNLTSLTAHHCDSHLFERRS